MYQIARNPVDFCKLVAMALEPLRIFLLVDEELHHLHHWRLTLILTLLLFHRKVVEQLRIFLYQSGAAVFVFV